MAVAKNHFQRCKHSYFSSNISDTLWSILFGSTFFRSFGSDHDEIDNTLKLLLGCCNLLMAPKAHFILGQSTCHLGARDVLNDTHTHHSSNTLNTRVKRNSTHNPNMHASFFSIFSIVDHHHKEISISLSPITI